MKMKISLRFCAFLLTVFGMHPVSSWASGETRPSFVQIKHVGEEDKPIPTLVITADATVAGSFREAFNTRVHLLSEAAYAKVDNFFAQESTKRYRTESAPGELKDFGNFEVSERTQAGTVKAFCFIMPRRESLEIFGKFSRYLSEQKIDASLQGDISVLIKRVE